tara:strand:+ start:1439 stop:1930 length:492 start_codon:yes stop_codon:yes gene_type:complete
VLGDEAFGRCQSVEVLCVRRSTIEDEVKWVFTIDRAIREGTTFTKLEDTITIHKVSTPTILELILIGLEVWIGEDVVPIHTSSNHSVCPMVWFSTFIHSVIIIQALDVVAFPVITPDGVCGYTYPTCSNLFPDNFPGVVLGDILGEVDELHRGITLGVDTKVA